MQYYYLLRKIIWINVYKNIANMATIDGSWVETFCMSIQTTFRWKFGHAFFTRKPVRIVVYRAVSLQCLSTAKMFLTRCTCYYRIMLFLVLFQEDFALEGLVARDACFFPTTLLMVFEVLLSFEGLVAHRTGSIANVRLSIFVPLLNSNK